MVYIQRSRGYELRPSLSVDEIGKVCEIAKKKIPNVIVMVDNCYGEFVEKSEPTQVGADLIAGSMIKKCRRRNCNYRRIYRRQERPC